MSREEIIENLKRILREAQAHEETMRLNYIMAQASADCIRRELMKTEGSE